MEVKVWPGMVMQVYGNACQYANADANSDSYWNASKYANTDADCHTRQHSRTR
jgi:hypothetical protein